MRVCFDATVLCGALVRPTGQNWRLLAFAAESPVLEGFTTDVAGLEFVRNALDGISGNVYDLDEIEEFLEVFEPLFDPDNVARSPIGRGLVQRTSQGDGELHGWLSSLQLTDDAAVDTDDIGERALAQAEFLSSVANSFPELVERL